MKNSERESNWPIAGGTDLLVELAERIGAPVTTTISGKQLPAPEPKFGGVIKNDALESKPWWAPRIVPPKQAPNVLVIMLDDAGFGVPSTFGGVIPTPTMDRIANEGLRYNRVFSTALCSPTRQALLTGRNHHSVNMGGITEMATSAPGYTSVLPKNKAPLAMTLKLNGYATAQFGKCHEVPVWQTSPMGPFDSWPTGGGGFEYFYGFVGGDASALPPGESIRKTTALMPEALRTSRKALAMVSEPMISSPRRGFRLLPLAPRMMAPVAVTTASISP